MTTPTPQGAVPELPVVAHLVTNSHGSSWVQKHPGTIDATEEPLVKLSDARAAIQQATGAVPEGWKLVPIEPTVEMTRASAMWLKNIHIMRATDRTNAIHDAYKAMLAASPTPPACPAIPGDSDHLVPCAGGGAKVPLLFSRRMAIARGLGLEANAQFNAIVRAVELAHSIDWMVELATPPRPDAPTSQINPGSAPREGGHE